MEAFVLARLLEQQKPRELFRHGFSTSLPARATFLAFLLALFAKNNDGSSPPRPAQKVDHPPGSTPRRELPAQRRPCGKTRRMLGRLLYSLFGSSFYFIQMMLASLVIRPLGNRCENSSE